MMCFCSLCGFFLHEKLRVRSSRKADTLGFEGMFNIISFKSVRICRFNLQRLEASHTLRYQHNTYYFFNKWTKRSVTINVVKRNISGLSAMVDVSSWCTTNSSSNVNWASPVHLVPGDGRYSESCFSRTAIFVAADPRQRRNRYEKANWQTTRIKLPWCTANTRQTDR